MSMSRVPEKQKEIELHRHSDETEIFFDPRIYCSFQGTGEKAMKDNGNLRPTASK